MTKTEQIINNVEENVIHTYNRYQIALDRGEGMYLYDAEGKKYLDFGSGIGVFALGYGNKEYNDAVKVQVDKLIHTSNYFYNEPASKAAVKMTKASGMEKVFFTNSKYPQKHGQCKHFFDIDKVVRYRRELKSVQNGKRLWRCEKIRNFPGTAVGKFRWKIPPAAGIFCRGKFICLEKFYSMKPFEFKTQLHQIVKIFFCRYRSRYQRDTQNVSGLTAAVKGKEVFQNIF